MLNILAGVATGGVAMNPFRALAPAIWEGDLSNAWVWTIGGFLGASLGAVTYEYSFMRREHPACPKVPSTAGSNHLKHEHTS
ncbi:hypothetical protein Pelo_18350 [Pelomyxa schiedti]|nr:hypothetical protein Pelo_18350 [Pelomyxa schiedti]